MQREAQVLIAEDHEAEVEIYKVAFQKIGFKNLSFVNDGVEVVEYLQGEGKYSDRTIYPFPRWLIVDIKMPRMGGLEVLKWLQEHPACNIVPTTMLSNSQRPEDIIKAYQLGVNAYFTKPSRLQDTVELLAMIVQFWSIAQMPPLTAGGKCG
jgi:CheY-like chemotaxis protein